MEKAGIRLTIGGEPTYIPISPVGAEWQYAAVGPTKLTYARQVARCLLNGPMAGGFAIHTPGKLYPGEVNPRWAIRVVANRDGSPIVPDERSATRRSMPGDFGRAVCKALGVRPHWLDLTDPTTDSGHVMALPIDHDGESWQSSKWPLPPRLRTLLNTEGPAGLRLPLEHFPAGVARRVLVLEIRGKNLEVFLPPFLQSAFLELLAAVYGASAQTGIPIDLSGYLPQDDAGLWTVIGVASDPGVLEINLPASTTWDGYARWLGEVTRAAASSGLRTWKEIPGEPDEGTGGGNHVLWGGATLETNPFFTRPAWLASILRYWQRHPSLAYLFTGCYVGSSSQAPRPDESARDLEDLEMAYSFLESLTPGDHRGLINETLRHLHTDVTGNAHRSEISFDKFWNPQWTGGALGLIEFRAVESLPRADFMAAPALLFSCIAAFCLDHHPRQPLKPFGSTLRDRFFLPSILWEDFDTVLKELDRAGYHLPRELFREIWEWKFPVLLEWKGITIRKAHEEWPLLCETPVEGGTTSRFVDTSVRRLEVCARLGTVNRHDVYVAGRHLPLRSSGDRAIAGLRYRRTHLYPSLHPGIPPQLPLDVTLVDRATHRVAAAFRMESGSSQFTRIPTRIAARLVDNPCRTRQKGAWTYDLRLP
ncbi:MAG: hypothetical protein Fur0032_13360 [Terrimicrobiaceae bacterium]